MRRALAILTLVAAHADAAELWKSKDEKWLIEANGFYKPYASWLILQPSLVSGTQAIADAAAAAGSPTNTAVPPNVGLGTNTGRIGARVSWNSKVEFIVAYQVAAVISTSPAFANATATSYLGSYLVAPQRRFADLPLYLFNQNGFAIQQNLDRLAIKYATDKFSLTVGRQALSWGTGRLWNPTDLISPFSPTDFDREVRRGADAVRASISAGPTTQFDLLWLPQQKAADQMAIVRAVTNIKGWDVSMSVAKYISDLVLGADFAGDLGPFGVHGEGAWTLPLNALDKLGFVRAVGGLDWRPTEKWILTLEYYFNGFGALNKSMIVQKLRDPRLVSGEIFGAERHYVGLVANFLATELLTANMTVLVNCMDPSVTFAPVVEYSFEQHVLIRLGAFVPIGRGVDVTFLQTLTAHDAATNSASWQYATQTLAAQSEYGLSPYGVFVQVGLYLN
jgi:hypothetical protein